MDKASLPPLDIATIYKINLYRLVICACLLFVSLVSYRGVAVGLCLFSNTCFGFAMNFLGSHEGTGEGVNWVNAVEPISSQNQLHLGFVFGMMLLDIVVFFVFAW